MMRCTRCLIPDTRPDTHFKDGVCSACFSFDKRPNVDWAKRRSELEAILADHTNFSGFDCVVGSSGGKDSHWQVLKLIELGARPLVVTAATCMLTDIGRKNIDNLARYATTIEVTPNRTVRAKLNRLGLQLVGDVSWPEHVSIFTTPFRVAADLGIPLVFYGECPQEAYGGPPGSDENRKMTRRWVSEFGGFLGLRPADMVGLEGITERDMTDYLPPSEEAMQRVGVTAYFMGQFFRWDSRENARVATDAGMESILPSPANWWKTENQDNAMTGIHDFFGFLKYGFGRAAAQLSVDVRSGLMSRDEAMTIVREKDGLFPSKYMDVPIARVLNRIGITENEFVEICNNFTNGDLFDGTSIEFGKRPTLKEFSCLAE